MFFIAGLFTLLPIILTFWILGGVFIGLDSILGDQLTSLFGFRIPGLGLILELGFIIIVGMVTSNVVGKKMTEIVEKNLVRIPVLKTIYLPVRDILSNFTDKKSNNFKKAVLVEYPKANIYSMGFITKESIEVDGIPKTVVFIPTTPNPTSGFLVYLNKGEYKEIDIPVDTALKSIVSLGSISPDVIKVRKE
jgi:uncharacterized membrane protein